MGSWIGITLIQVGGASACGGLEAEGQEYFALCLNEVILKQSAPESKVMLFPLFIPHYSTIPTIHHPILQKITRRDNGVTRKVRETPEPKSIDTDHAQ